MIEDRLTTISGKDLTLLLRINPYDYVSLYPRRGLEDYCPCMDLGIYDCSGMLTVMDALAKDEIAGFPQGTRRVRWSKYKSGEVWVDNLYQMAYFYIGKSPKRRDVVLVLGGDCGQGYIETGYIFGVDDKPRNIPNHLRIHFDRKVFPKQ